MTDNNNFSSFPKKLDRELFQENKKNKVGYHTTIKESN